MIYIITIFPKEHCWLLLEFFSPFIAFASSTPVDKISITSEVIKDVTLSSALAYWSADCGDRTYVGSDGQYRRDSGEPFTYDDFFGNPGTDPYIHLPPGNN